jgi:cyanate permease
MRVAFATVYIGLTTMVTRWFVRRRNVALTLALTGLGLSGALMVPATAKLIELFGWRWAFAIAGLIVLAVGLPPILFILRSKPEDLGLRADGDPKPAPGAEGTGATPVRDGYEPRGRVLWQIGALFLLAFIVNQAVTTHAVPYFQAQGMGAAEAAALFGAAAGVGFVGRFVSGLSFDRLLGPRPMLLALLACQILGVGGLLVGGWGLYAFVGLYGFSLGGLPISESLTTAAYFGAARYGKAIGRVLVFDTIGSAVGPILAGVLYDIHGGYGSTLWVLLALGVVNLGGALFLPSPVRVDGAGGRS